MPSTPILGCSTVEVVHPLKAVGKESQTKNVSISTMFSQITRAPDKMISIRTSDGHNCGVSTVKSIVKKTEPTEAIRIFVENGPDLVVHPNSSLYTNFGKVSAHNLLCTLRENKCATIFLRSYGLPTPRVLPEKWKYVKDFPKYEVSTNGRVVFNSSHKGKILKTIEKVPRSLDRCVTLHTCNPNRTKTFLIRDLVLETFVGLDDSVSHSRYIGRNKRDNSLGNLQWVLKEDLGHNNTVLPASVPTFKQITAAEKSPSAQESTYILETDARAVYVDKILTVAI